MPPNLSTGYWEAFIDDAGFATDPGYRASLRDFDLASNTDWVSTPLQLDYATNTIRLDVANAHFEPDGTTVFHGHAEFTLPNTMLASLYNVDDPAALTAGSFAVTTGGSTATTTVTINPASVNVVIDGLTFSRRTLKVAGRTNPTRPGHLKARRTSATRAVVTTTGSRSRGSRIRGYVATCSWHGHTVTGKTSDHNGGPAIHLRGLRAGHRYRCRVQARSHAGRSPAGMVMIGARRSPPEVRRWAQGHEGWTITVGTYNQAVYTESFARSKARAAIARHVSAGFLDSNLFSSLQNDLWVVFHGDFATEAAADDALPLVRDTFPGAAVRHVVP